jgi:hypothetical protein
MRWLRPSMLLGLTAAAALGILAGIFWVQRNPTRHAVRAAIYSSGSFDAAKSLQNSSGGMAQYGYAIQQATSASADLQAISNWNAYIASRSGWSMSSTMCSRLANADWNARQAGAPTITPQQLADAANHLIASTWGTMTASQQMSLILQNDYVGTPKGRLGVIADVGLEQPYVSVTQNPDGAFAVTVEPGLFSNDSIGKAFFQSYAPGMVSSGTNLYPAEVMLVTYAVASGDRGFDDARTSRTKTIIGDVSGLDMTNNVLYGDSGYLDRRPLSTFLTDQTLAQYFTDLGF